MASRIAHGRGSSMDGRASKCVTDAVAHPADRRSPEPRHSTDRCALVFFEQCLSLHALPHRAIVRRQAGFAEIIAEMLDEDFLIRSAGFRVLSGAMRASFSALIAFSTSSTQDSTLLRKTRSDR